MDFWGGAWLYICIFVLHPRLSGKRGVVVAVVVIVVVHFFGYCCVRDTLYMYLAAFLERCCGWAMSGDFVLSFRFYSFLDLFNSSV